VQNGTVKLKMSGTVFERTVPGEPFKTDQTCSGNRKNANRKRPNSEVSHPVAPRVDPLQLDVVSGTVLDDDADLAVADLDVGGLNARAELDDEADVTVWRRQNSELIEELVQLASYIYVPQLELDDFLP